MCVSTSSCLFGIQLEMATKIVYYYVFLKLSMKGISKIVLGILACYCKVKLRGGVLVVQVPER